MLAISPVLHITFLYLAYFIPSSLYLLILYPNIAPPPTPSPVVATTFVLCIYESVSVLLYLFICFIFQIPHISNIIHYLYFSVLFH